MVDQIASPGLKDLEILDLFDDVIKDWWVRSFSKHSDLFTPPQRLAIPLIHDEKNVLICSPTGSGKTLSAFISIVKLRRRTHAASCGACEAPSLG